MGRGALGIPTLGTPLALPGWVGLGLQVVRFLMNFGWAVAGRDQLGRLIPSLPTDPMPIQQILGILRDSCGNHTQ